MAITNTNVTVAATAGGTALHGGLRGSVEDPVPLTIYNPGAAPVFVGGSGVTASNGVAIAAGASSSFNLVDGDVLYGIVSTVTTTVSVMKGRQ